MTPDTINALFETLAGFFILLSILRLRRDRIVRGISITHVIFFWFWGAWNIYYYPHLGQFLSTLGATLVLMFNTIWTMMIIYYNWEEKWEARRR